MVLLECRDPLLIENYLLEFLYGTILRNDVALTHSIQRFDRYFDSVLFFLRQRRMRLLSMTHCRCCSLFLDLVRSLLLDFFSPFLCTAYVELTTTVGNLVENMSNFHFGGWTAQVSTKLGNLTIDNY